MKKYENMVNARFWSPCSNYLRFLSPFKSLVERKKFSHPRIRNFNSSNDTRIETNKNEKLMTSHDVKRIRNIAIIAHVDHGKTTLVDKLLKQAGENFQEERLLDSNALEKERGITIVSKATRIQWRDNILNIIDTPGHSDFGGEVERILSMVDGVCLIVDVIEGPKSQTKFVLQKALNNDKCKPIVVINKVDRESDRKQGDSENEIFDLFLVLDANEYQTDYPIFYASGKNGWIEESWENIKKSHHEKGMSPLLDKIIEVIPCPLDNTKKFTKEIQNNLKTKDELDQLKDMVVFGMLVTIIEYVDGVGVVVTGKIYSGFVSKGDNLYVKSQCGKIKGPTVIKQVCVNKGNKRENISHGFVGDIVSLITHKGVCPNVTDTLCNHVQFPSIKSIPIDPPVISIVVSPNTSPLAGKDGSHNTLQAIGQRLKREALVNVGVEVLEGDSSDSFEIRGRGELQLGILIETMRREGYEMTISPPSVMYIKDDDGKLLEPWEKFTVEIPSEVSPTLFDKIGIREAEIIDMCSIKNSTITQVVFKCSSRNFLGMRSQIRDISKGTAIVVSELDGYRPKAKNKISDRNGVIISSSPGITTAFALDPIQSKGILFVGENTPTYAGAIIGEHNSLSDIEMNAVRIKPVQHLRQKGSEETIRIVYKSMNIENCLSYIQEDEQVEVTPKRITMRKKYLSVEERKLFKKAT